MHLFAGEDGPAVEAEVVNGASASTQSRNPADSERIAQLEIEVDALRRELETLREQFANFQKQFQ